MAVPDGQGQGNHRARLVRAPRARQNKTADRGSTATSTAGFAAVNSANTGSRSGRLKGESSLHTKSRAEGTKPPQMALTEGPRIAPERSLRFAISKGEFTFQPFLAIFGLPQITTLWIFLHSPISKGGRFGVGSRKMRISALSLLPPDLQRSSLTTRSNDSLMRQCQICPRPRPLPHR
jgi:hypothetical protein